jgi:hypothetical protein
MGNKENPMRCPPHAVRSDCFHDKDASCEIAPPGRSDNRLASPAARLVDRLGGHAGRARCPLCERSSLTVKEKPLWTAVTAVVVVRPRASRIHSPADFEGEAARAAIERIMAGALPPAKQRNCRHDNSATTVRFTKVDTPRWLW